MSLTGHVKDGVIVLDTPGALPKGAAQVRAEQVQDEEEAHSGISFEERYASVIGKAKGLPPDASQNIDHYLCGSPKQ